MGDRPPSRNALKGGTESVWWVEVPPAQPGKRLLFGTAWATYSQATPKHCCLLLCSLQISVLSVHWRTGSFHGFLSTSQYSLFLPLSTGKLVFPPSSEIAKFWLLCNTTFGNFHTPALLWSKTTTSPFFFLPFQIGKPFNKFIFQVCFLLSLASAFPFSDLFLDTQWSACPNTF